jgi:hypothetical protein
MGRKKAARKRAAFLQYILNQSTYLVNYLTFQAMNTKTPNIKASL